MTRKLSYMYVQLNRGCNIKCNHCDFWKLGEDPTGMTDAQIAELISEYREVAGPQARVVTCGGEPLMVKDRYFGIAKQCRQLDLKFMSVTNGTLIKTPEFAEKVIAEGPHEVSVSLDAPDAETHDRLRGGNGLWAVSTRGIRLMADARARLGLGNAINKIYVMGLVTQSIVGKLDAFYDLCLNQLGADKLKLNVMQPSFGQGPHDHFFRDEQIRDIPGFIEEVKATDAKYGIARNPLWLHQVAMYMTSTARSIQRLEGWSAHAQMSEHICNTYERNIMVDLWGNMRLCFSGDFPSVKWSGTGNLRAFWEVSSAPIAEQMTTCNQYCAISHSVRKESATMRQIPILQDGGASGVVA